MLIKRFQLGLIHVAVAMTLVPINSTLNRVMIKELALSATLVAVLASLPYLFSPIQMAIGSFSDRHPLFGFRRTPYILFGLALCVAGVMLAPYAALRMAEDFLPGLLLGVLAFGAWGMGFNFASVSYLSLASEISGEGGRGRTIAVMWFMMIISIIFTAIGLSRMVDPYTPQALQRAFQAVGLAALGLGLLGVLRLEPRRGAGQWSALPAAEAHSWSDLFRAVLANPQARLFFWYLIILLAAILGQDILLEPYGGQAFGLTVTETTRITSLWGACFLFSLLIAGPLERRIAKVQVARLGGWIALAGFGLIALGGPLASLGVFYGGVVLLGVGSGFSTVANLGLMLDMTTAEQVGLFVGAWGMANAISRLMGSVLGGALRDALTRLIGDPVLGYALVFALEGGLLFGSLLLLRRIDVSAFRRQAAELTPLERIAAAGEA